MKRSPLTRRTPLKRKTSLCPMSAKKRQERAETDGPRREYREMFVMCQICCRRKATETHEIARGAHRSEGIRARCAWLCVCRRCHDDEVGDYSRWPVTRQLAAKLVRDTEFFDLDIINKIRGRDADAITLADVAKWLEVA